MDIQKEHVLGFMEESLRKTGRENGEDAVENTRGEEGEKGEGPIQQHGRRTGEPEEQDPRGMAQTGQSPRQGRTWKLPDGKYPTGKTASRSPYSHSKW